jgi:hypothetical protein
MRKKLPPKVLVYPSKANLRAVDILRKTPPLDKAEFTFLQVDLHRAAESLEKHQREGILIWGDGNTHHLSKFFDIKEPCTKRILDNHDDYDSGYGYDEINYANHAFFSEMGGAKVELAVTKFCMAELDMGRRIKNFFKGENSRKNIERMLTLVTEHNEKFADDMPVHLSIDFDCLDYFPAYSRWMSKSGFSVDEIIESLEIAMVGNRLLRLDLGGLGKCFPMMVEPGCGSGISDIRSTPDLSGIAIYDAIQCVNEYEEDGSLEISQEIRELGSRLANHALNAYYRVLSFAMF